MRAALLLLLSAATGASPQTRPLVGYGHVLDRFGTPVPGATVEVTAVDISPDVPAGARAPVGPGQCVGARPVTGRALAVADGRFRLLLDLGVPAPTLICLAIRTTPPAGRPVTPMDLAMDSVAARAILAAGDSVLMDIMLPDAAAVLPGAASSGPPLAPPPAFHDADEELRWLAGAIPGGFGGSWRTGAGEPMKVYLVDLAQAARAKRLLQEYYRLRPPAGGAPPDILFMRGRWDAATLLGWRDRLRRAGAAAGVRAAVLRLDWNRVQVSVRGAGGRARLRARLGALGIPEAALLVVGG